eukprot:4457446-Prymnesium_polylepis.1
MALSNESMNLPVSVSPPSASVNSRSGQRARRSTTLVPASGSSSKNEKFRLPDSFSNFVPSSRKR